jgi:competence protein ComEC
MGAVLVALLVAVAVLHCGIEGPGRRPALRFGVFDVGQGLAQMAVCDGKAIALDMGDAQSHSSWAAEYLGMGAPAIELIVISHTHADHYGGLKHLAAATDFSGMVVISPYADTALIRRNAGAWRKHLAFRTISRGDTLGSLEGVWVECLWPPDSEALTLQGLTGADTNRVSLCFLLRFEHTAVIITSDIDTVATRALATAYGPGLRAAAVMVPHHGSRFSLDPLFYGYVNPETAIISCGRDNEYGHPAPTVLRFLAFQSRIALLRTDEHGTIEGYSNGEYWVWKVRCDD